MMRKRKIKNRIVSGLLILLVALAMGGLYPVRKASATMSAKSDTMSRLQDNTASNHEVEFTTSVGVTVGQNITVTFPAAFDTSTIIEDDVDVKDDAVELTTAANCSGTEDASVVMSGDVLTVEICSEYTGGIGAGSVVNIEIGTNATSSGTGTHQIINPDISSDTTYEITIGGTMSDSGQLEVQVLVDDTVNITAAVDESISFSISDTAIGFGDLNSSTGRWATADAAGGNASDPALPTAAHTMAIGTNADNGWAITYFGATLTSGGNTITDIASVTSDSDGTPGSEQFGLCASTGGDSTIASGYERTADANWDFVPNTVTTLASESVPTATETISVSYLANIAALTESGSYFTDITYIATASF